MTRLLVCCLWIVWLMRLPCDLVVGLLLVCFLLAVTCCLFVDWVELAVGFIFDDGLMSIGSEAYRAVGGFAGYLLSDDSF